MNYYVSTTKRISEIVTLSRCTQNAHLGKFNLQSAHYW